MWSVVTFAEYYILLEVHRSNGKREQRYIIPSAPDGQDCIFIELACGEWSMFESLFRKKTVASGQLDCNDERHRNAWCLYLRLKKDGTAADDVTD
jgi:hypothetical protein